MNHKGFELAISTIVLLLLGVIVLFGLVYVLTDGFTKFQRTSGTLAGSSEAAGVSQACRIACAAQDKTTYCCRNFTIGGVQAYCSDSRFDLNCALECEGFACVR